MTGWHGDTEPRAARRARRWVVWGIVVVTIGAGAVLWWRQRIVDAETQRAGTDGALPTDSAARAPAGQRIKVRIVNASQRRGLARRATLVLRDFGYDVVEYDGQSGPPRPSTEILMHTGHREAALRLRRALGAGSIAERADTSRYVDLTVILGRDWYPPAQPLRP